MGKDFKVEAGEIATAWSPNFQDAVYKGAEYTNSQISVVEGKITSTVEKINTVDGRVTGLASRIEQTEKVSRLLLVILVLLIVPPIGIYQSE